jgi:GSCFA family
MIMVLALRGASPPSWDVPRAPGGRDAPGHPVCWFTNNRAASRAAPFPRRRRRPEDRNPGGREGEPRGEQEGAHHPTGKRMSWRTVQPHVGTRWQRDSNPLPHPVNPHKFLNKRSRAYSIGSCFAVNLNRWLRFQGFSVPPVTWGMHYNTRTILYELQGAVGIPTPGMDWIVTRKDGAVAHVDALRHCIDANSAEELHRLKSTIRSESSESFRKADCFLITLGLSDIWEVEVDGRTITLNRAPYRDARSPAAVTPHKVTNRFLSVQECVEDIRQIVGTIRAHKPAGTPIVITVSPVPLKHTTDARHPHIANSRSKSTLLSAVFSFMDEDAGEPKASYFPSFEFFQTNPLRIDLWQADDRHPTARAISSVAEAFVATYSESEIDIRPGFSVPIFE